jgi:hypothetical protein
MARFELEDVQKAHDGRQSGDCPKPDTEFVTLSGNPFGGFFKHGHGL